MNEKNITDDKPSSPEGVEVILDIGAEGGGLTLFGRRTPAGWEFMRELVDHSAAMLDEPTIHHRSEVVNTLEEGLCLLDRYPWHRLFPLKVHPEFSAAILAAVRQRIAHDGEGAARGLGRWERVCSEGSES